MLKQKYFSLVLLYCSAYISTSVNGQKVLRITGDANVQLYVDGNWKPLSNGGDWTQLDSYVIQEDKDRLIAFYVTGDNWCSGIIASTDNDDFMTGYTFRCTGTFYSNWETIGYDDIYWRFSYVVADNDGMSPVCPRWGRIPQISEEAKWIWTANVSDSVGDLDKQVFCRGYLPVCDSSPCQNNGYCQPNNPGTICECPPGYTGQFCETHMIQPCGDLMHVAPPDIAIHPLFDVYCYIGFNDTNYLDYTCRQLVIGLPDYDTADDLIAAGGNFGCWLAPDYPNPDLSYACVDNFQHNRALAYCFNCKFMGVCIRYPLIKT